MRLALVTHRRLVGDRFLDVMREAVAGGVDAVILREHDASPRELLALAKECRAIAHAARATFIVNHSLDVALAAEADGVHLGWRSLPAREVRKIAPSPFLVGVSAHSAEAAARLTDEPVDYVFLGPIFPTPSKVGLVEPIGPQAIRAARKAVKIPIIAIGGIKEGNIAETLAAGAAGVAVISAIMGAGSPREAAEALRNRMKDSA